MVEMIEGQPIMRPQTVAHFTTPRGVSVLMTIRDGTNDWNTLNACMTEDEYGLRDWRGAGTAVDIGGYLGGVGIGLAIDNPDLRVLIVEPVPDNARLIRENVERNGVGDRVEVMENAMGGPERKPVAVWFNYRGTESLEHHAFVGNSSIAYDHGGDAPHDEVVYEHPITLDDLVLHVGGDLALVKIDCEGGEWDILRSSLLEHCPLIVGEAHSVRGHKGGDITGLLAKTHDVFITGDPEATCEFRAVAR